MEQISGKFYNWAKYPEFFHKGPGRSFRIKGYNAEELVGEVKEIDQRKQVITALFQNLHIFSASASLGSKKVKDSTITDHHSFNERLWP